jgi:Divergent InlB B-repeat domain
MKKQLLLTPIVAFALPLILALFPLYLAAQSEEPPAEEPQAEEEPAEGADAVTANVSRPLVFQAAGPTAESIQGTVDAFRAALGDPNNANNPGPLASGRREINWDGAMPGVTDNTTDPVTPFEVFLNTRGARFTTPGTGLSQAPVEGGSGPIFFGLVGLFENGTYATTFAAFSPLRLFTPVGSNLTDGQFFIPGTNGADPAVVTGFGVVFSDVDKPNGRNRMASTVIRYFGAADEVLFTGLVPASPGDATFSFFGIVFDEPLIARVRIKTGDTAPGPNDTNRRDIVVMDDFLYGEPQPQNGEVPTPSPSPSPAAATQARTAAAGSQALTVINGSASGTTPGTMVTVTANPAPAGQIFAGWTGDISILGNPGEATTTATVPPTTPATITATYAPAP